MTVRSFSVCIAFWVVGFLPASRGQTVWVQAQDGTETIRFATFNTSFFRDRENQLAEELQASSKPDNPRRIAEIIQRVRPDVLLLNEFDFDAEGAAIAAFQKNFLGQPQGDQRAIEYPHVYFAAVNTGVDCGLDLDGDGKLHTANDCFGFGKYPGQYGMVVLSRFPIFVDQVRTFQNFLWKDMPGHQMPLKPGTDEPYYSPSIQAIFRLSSKSHWDVPIQIGSKTVHFLVAHPTPPVFDQEEDRNGRRNHDEIRLFTDYVTPGKSDYLYDDRGRRGGLEEGALFVIAGDMNADPVDGDSRQGAARQLTEHRSIAQDPTPESEGGEYFSVSQGEKNKEHRGNPAFDTGDFRDSSVGNLRLDYCLPSVSLGIKRSGVFWPKPDQAGFSLIEATDHRMVWIDVPSPK